MVQTMGPQPRELIELLERVRVHLAGSALTLMDAGRRIDELLGIINVSHPETAILVGPQAEMLTEVRSWQGVQEFVDLVEKAAATPAGGLLRVAIATKSGMGILRVGIIDGQPGGTGVGVA